MVPPRLQGKESRMSSSWGRELGRVQMRVSSSGRELGRVQMRVSPLRGLRRFGRNDTVLVRRVKATARATANANADSLRG